MKEPRFEISHDPVEKIFSLEDREMGEVIVLRDEQLEELIKEYCIIFGHTII